MIDLPIYSHDGKKVDSLKIDPVTLGGEVRFALLKQAYVAVHLNQRQGSARTKSRGSVHGSTRKIYKQKERVEPAQAPFVLQSARVVELHSQRRERAKICVRHFQERCDVSPTATLCSRSLLTAK